MTAPFRYSPLSDTQLRLLVDPREEELRDAWHGAMAALDGMVSIFSQTYPRPLYWSPESYPDRLREAADALAATPLAPHLAANAEAAREIQRWGEDRGHTPELHEAVDRFVDALLEDTTAVRHRQPVRRRLTSRPADARRSAAG